MTQDMEQAPLAASRQSGLAEEPAWPRVTQRGIQIALGASVAWALAVWIVARESRR